MAVVTLMCVWGGGLFSSVQVESLVAPFTCKKRTRGTVEMQTFLKGRRVGYWLSEKKMKKLNFQAFADLCRFVN